MPLCSGSNSPHFLDYLILNIKSISLKCWYQCLYCISDEDELYWDIKTSYLTVIFWKLFFAVPFMLYYIWILTGMLKHTRSQA